MKEVELCFIGLGYSDINQAEVYIYNCSNELIINKKTYNSKLKVSLSNNCVYKIILKSLYVKESFTIYINCNTNKYYLPLKCSLLSSKSRIITFILTDYNYNLPIEKGEILLWQK